MRDEHYNPEKGEWRMLFDGGEARIVIGAIKQALDVHASTQGKALNLSTARDFTRTLIRTDLVSAHDGFSMRTSNHEFVGILADTVSDHGEELKDDAKDNAIGLAEELRDFQGKVAFNQDIPRELPQNFKA